MKWKLIALAGIAVLAWSAHINPGGRWWAHVKYLADDKLEGRLTGSPGHRKAAEYVAQEFERAGLKPAGVSGYLQPVKLRARKLVEKESSMALVRNGKAEPLALGEDAILSVRVDPADTVDAPLVFAGYALTIPEKNYDDYAGLDLRGKVAVYFTGGPAALAGPLRSHYESSAERARFLQRAGAIGMIFIPNPKTMDIPWARIAVSRFQTSMSLADPAMDESYGQKFLAMFNPERAEKLFAGSGHTLADLRALAVAEKPLPRFPLTCSVRAKIKVDRWAVESQNVAAVLPGSDPALRKEYVVLSAHLDHLGVGEPIHGDRIYNGAMDNASGIASLLDMAQRLKESGAKPRRSILFVAVTGEEKGELGSRYFAVHPTVDRKSIVADLNVDMFLPLYPLKLLTVYGLDESDLGEEALAAGKKLGIEIQRDPEPQRNVFIRSDQYSFIRSGVPSLAFKVGFRKGSPEEAIAKAWLKERYHAPSDDVDQPVDIQAAAGFDAAVLEIAQTVANRTARPKWKESSFFKRFVNN